MATLTATGDRSGHHIFTLTATDNTPSGSFYGSVVHNVYCEFKLSNNQSGWDWSGYGSQIAWEINLFGNVYSGTIPSYDGSSEVTLWSGIVQYTQDYHGTPSVPFSFSVKDNSTANYTCGNASASGNMELTLQSKEYTLTLNANGGTLPDFSNVTTKTISPNLVYDSSNWYSMGYAAKRSGYAFQGWFDAPNGGTQVYDIDGNCINGTSYWRDGKWIGTSDLTVYAQWKSKGLLHINQNGTYVNGLAWVRDNGTWKKGIPWVKVNGIWKKGGA